MQTQDQCQIDNYGQNNSHGQCSGYGYSDFNDLQLYTSNINSNTNSNGNSNTTTVNSTPYRHQKHSNSSNYTNNLMSPLGNNNTNNNITSNNVNGSASNNIASDTPNMGYICDNYIDSNNTNANVMDDINNGSGFGTIIGCGTGSGTGTGSSSGIIGYKLFVGGLHYETRNRK